MRKLSKHRPLPINVDLDALHLQSEGDLEDHGLASLDVPVEALTAATLRDPVALESRLLEADRYLGRLTRGAATLREDLVLLVPYLVFLAEFSADQGSASRTASPKGATQVATPWGSATRLHAGGVGRPANEALYLAAFSADYLLWNAGVDDPERAARVIRALFGLGFVGHIEHYDTARHATAVGALVRERDAYLRMGREIRKRDGVTAAAPLGVSDSAGCRSAPHRGPEGAENGATDPRRRGSHVFRIASDGRGAASTRGRGRTRKPGDVGRAGPRLSGPRPSPGWRPAHRLRVERALGLH